MAALLIGGCIPPQARLPDVQPLPPAPDRAGASAPAPAPPLAPAWAPKPVTPDAVTVAAGSYIVQPGDTLRSIASVTGAASEAIARVNGIAPPFIIRPGQRLAIPAGRYHLVRQGETGLAIARAYHVAWQAIIAANDLEDPYILRAGQRIIIPAGPRSLPDKRRGLDINDLLTGTAPAVDSEARIPAPPPATALPGTTTTFAWPARGPIVARFGHGASGERHDGIEIGLPIGTAVAASADGVVAFAGEGVPGLGGVVIVKHPGGWATVYGHARRVLVTRDEVVRRGQTIALSGNSGFADRPQLHFEIRKNRLPVDPLANLPAR